MGGVDDIVCDESGLMQGVASLHETLDHLPASRFEDHLAILDARSCSGMRADADRESRHTLL